ncbi:nucleotidyltransferase domain-containing protein [Marinomonas transparens]|uniref:Cyclic GMP-AMP synthase n=1 Tax=Marinomonas transparens TaxID=2795388 RepID=A0A934N1W6_9GAMM|nr:nucleotidyltransferase [Marinomonas transparens]MBJ7539920.1 nucleotidyltransferase [Marinomonas transparens]
MTTLFANARALNEHKKSMLVEMLDSVFVSLDLTKTQRERIEAAYNAVGDYLASCDDSLLDGVQIYPQGSMRLRTTNKPLSQEEFDVDLILFLPNAGSATRDQIVSVVKQHLLDSKVYKELVEDLPRGFRINYKGDYHLDITPAKAYDLESLPGHPLWVVDKLTGFKESNPEGMARNFDDACSLLPVIRRPQVFLAALDSKSVTALPDQSKKKPLNRIIQILKRHRDVWSQLSSNPHTDFKPISVVITTLACRAYVEVIESKKQYDNELDLILDVIELMPHHIESGYDGILIANPTMRSENYAEKWNRLKGQEGQKYRGAFYAWYQAAVDTFEYFASENSRGMDNVFATLSEAFGEKPVLAAQDRIVAAINVNRGNNKLGVALGTGVVIASIAEKANSATTGLHDVVPVKRNQFYGD